MPDKKGSIIVVERERRIGNETVTYTKSKEVMRAEHSGLDTVHVKATAGTETPVFTVPPGFMAFITRLNWEWPDGDGPHYLVGGIGGPFGAQPLYWQGIMWQMVPDDRPGLDWGDGSYPILIVVEGVVVADCVACLDDSELTITYYLERAM